MKVKRIVANVKARDPAAAKAFYQAVLGLELLMDFGWIATYGSRRKMGVQISFEFNRSVHNLSEFIGWRFEAHGLSRSLLEPQAKGCHSGRLIQEVRHP